MFQKNVGKRGILLPTTPRSVADWHKPTQFQRQQRIQHNSNSLNYLPLSTRDEQWKSIFAVRSTNETFVAPASAPVGSLPYFLVLVLATPGTAWALQMLDRVEDDGK